MKKGIQLSLSAMLFFVVSIANAGDTKIKLLFGAEYKLPKKHADVGFIGDAQRGYVQIGHAQNRSISFQKFDKNLKLVSEKMIDLKGIQKGYGSESWREVGNSYYWFFSTWNRKEQKERLFCQKINIGEGSFDGNAKELIETDKLAGGLSMVGFYSFAVTGKWNLVSSADKTKTLVYYRTRPKEKRDAKNNDIIGFNVFDENMNKLWGKEVTMPYTEAEMDNIDYQVDGKGNVFCLAKIWGDRKSKDKTKPNYHYEILSWSKDKPQVAKVPFKFDDKFVSSALLMEDYAGRIIVAGYYSKLFNSSSTDGAFILKVDIEAGAVTNVLKGTYEFPKELIKEYESARTQKAIDKKEKKKGDVEEPILTLRKVNINADGTIQIYGEQYQVVSHTYIDSKGVSHTTYTYYNLDIIALNIAKDGEVEWIKKIPKQQISGTSYGQGFSSFSYGDEKFFFFTDNPKNINLSTSQAPVTHGTGTRGTLMAVRIDATGKMSKSIVYDAKDNRTFLNATDFDRVGENQIITRSAQKGISKAMLLTFEK